MVIAYMREETKNSTKELIQLKNNFSKVAVFKIHSNNSVGFPYTKDKQTEKEIRETTPFTTDTNKIKYLGVAICKQAKKTCMTSP